MKWFKTNAFFDSEKDQYFWEFEERICFGHIVDYGESEWKKTFWCWRTRTTRA